MPAKIECPFSRDALKWHYEEGLKSAEAIAAIASDYLGHSVTGKTVRKWLRQKDIPLRSLSQNARIQHKRNPDFTKAAIDAANTKRMDMLHSGELRLDHKRTLQDGRFLKKFIRLGVEGRERQRAAKRETRECSLPGCSQIITGPPSRFDRGYACCCVSHARKLDHLRKSQLPQTVRLPDIPDWIAEVREDFRAKHGTI